MIDGVKYQSKYVANLFVVAEARSRLMLALSLPKVSINDALLLDQELLPLLCLPPQPAQPPLLAALHRCIYVSGLGSSHTDIGLPLQPPLLAARRRQPSLFCNSLPNMGSLQ